MAKHTPGPWKTDGFNVLKDAPNGVFVLASIDSETDEDRANLTLMAAAPELLEFLEQAVDHAEAFIDFDDEDPTIPGFYYSAKAAINKAKGLK